MPSTSWFHAMSSIPTRVLIVKTQSTPLVLDTAAERQPAVAP